ncbi:MFS general substrate transporter [Panus rudis PR-1116 ss-1]|nr:MFS general substrate transporter [Panus rudis PR-1116 ss-1]
MASSQKLPAVFSFTRVSCLLVSLLVALGSGTNYLFSAYGPQLASRLNLTHTRLNVISLAGTIGVYGTAPFMGKLVDTRGPRILITIAFFGLLVGYAGMRQMYVSGLPEGQSHLSNVGFFALLGCGFLSGIGGNGGIMAAMNVSAKSWPDRARATTTGLVLSMFGLSAFIFSAIGHVFFPGDTASFLLVLSIGTSLPMILGFFFVRPIPLPSSDNDTPRHPQEGDMRTPLLSHPDSPNTLTEDGEDGIKANYGQIPESTSDYTVPVSTSSTMLQRVNSSELSERGTRAEDSLPVESSRAVEPTRPAGAGAKGQQNIRGMALAKHGDFWMLFVITILLSGTGLMCKLQCNPGSSQCSPVVVDIGNVGLISQALYAVDSPVFDEKVASKWQATQVSTISISNSLGRIIIGIIADSSRHYMETPRSSYIAIVSLLFIASQIVAYNVSDIRHLWQASALTGFSYGSLFGLFPAVTIEWFGLHHFSENWGFMSLAPVIGNNILSIAFGRIFDAHSNNESSSPERDLLSALNSTSLVNIVSSSILNSRGGAGGSHSMCYQGRDCYADCLKLTIGACTAAFLLSVYAGYKDWRMEKEYDSAIEGYRPISVMAEEEV